MWTVGVIGTGSFGQKRVQTLLELAGHVADVYIYDQDPQFIQQTLAKNNSHRLHTFTQLNDTWENPQIDIVCICTPNSLHAQYAELALSHGKHVLCEKPLTTDPQVMKQLLTLAKKKQKIIKTGTNHRYFPSVQAVIKLMQTDQLGQVLSLHASIGTNGERIQHSWFWKHELSGGGTFVDNGHHLLDLALLLSGPFESCLGHSSKRRWLESEVEDYALAIFERPATTTDPGCEAVLRSAWRQPDGYFELELWTTTGQVKIVVSEKETLTTTINGQTETTDYSDYPKTSLQQELTLFLTECAEPAAHRSVNTAHLLNLSKMMTAFYASAQSGQKVEVK